MSEANDQNTLKNDLRAPAVVLVEPQMGENIGAAARAMLNCGLTDLRIVNPRDGWPNPSARSSSTGAKEVIDQARIYPTTVEALADLQHVYATTARTRGLNVRTCDLESAGKEWLQAAQAGSRVGIVFGPERTGLSNDDLVLAQSTLTIPLNPEFMSLNLGQAVLLASYEWLRNSISWKPEPAIDEEPPASGEEVANLLEHMKSGLERSGYLRVPHKRPALLRNLRNLLTRARMTSDEVRTFHGVVSSLSGYRKDGKPVKNLDSSSVARPAASGEEP